MPFWLRRGKPGDRAKSGGWSGRILPPLRQNLAAYWVAKGFAIMPIAELIDPGAIVLVWCSAFAIITLQEGREGFIRSLAIWRILLGKKPRDDAEQARLDLSRVRNVVAHKGLPCVDRAHCENAFVADALARLERDNDVRNFAQAMGDNLSAREERHNRSIRFWLAVADIAPAMGMVGTVIGLIRMFGQVADPAAIGAAMAIALLTTLYGLVLANVVAAPIAQRLLRLSSEELHWQRQTADALIDLASQEVAQIRPRAVAV
ncbi:MAG: MotA/TolQ/ExbB proton channel family protein [Parasphingorhabdus sp.]|nr:MotA/TolQ/ExbB proton channel family protein [Parasphingorhabdus sp.]